MYVDREGLVLAAAQVRAGDKSLPEQAHFKRALHGALGTSHGIDARYGQRVYSYAAPTFGSDGRVNGALIVVVDVENLEWDWPGGRPAVFFLDQGGEVFVSNRSELLYWRRNSEGTDNGLVRPDGVAPPFEAYERAGHRIWKMGWGPYLPDRGLHLVKPLPVIGMQAEAIVDIRPALRLAGLQAAVFAAVVGAVLLAFAMFLRQAMQRRRVLAQANAVLEHRVLARTQALSETNTQLRREVIERQEAEAALTKAQAELVQSGKLSALGQMSAGISHELNQPLMAIQQFAENGVLLMERGKVGQAGDNLGRISALSTRMARIIRNLRAFARNESEPVGKVDLVGVINAAVELTEVRLAKDAVTLEWEAGLHPEGVFALGGDVRLVQVFVNLITNAADAMMAQNARKISITISDGARLKVHVRDIGPGIQEPERIFDPFYSTKAVGSAEGMGLGLSISYGLVQSFGGDIAGRNVMDQSEVEQGGAVFTVELDHWAGLASHGGQKEQAE
jgi:two-component system C4-dicarboxylate transport sensor histidine kinase DctB